jgi:hypothetical protein
MDESTTDIHVAVRAVEASTEFSAWIAENPHHELVHVFASVSAAPAPTPGQSPVIEIGYYGRESEMITVFKTPPVERLPAQEVFKREEHPAPAALDLAAVRIGLSQTSDIAEATRAAAYARHPPMKTICILQQLDHPTWNLTMVTGTLQMITMRIDAVNGTVLSHAMHSLMSLVKE